MDQTLDSSKLTTSIEHAVSVLREGGVIAAPTDTLYGVLANAIDERAVARVFDVKGRHDRSPLPLFISDPAELAVYGRDVPDEAVQLAEAFWPGRLTIVVGRSERIPSTVSGGLPTVGLRIPDHAIPQAIVERLGAPVTATSANLTGGAPSMSANAVLCTIADRLDLIFDGGELAPSEPSTVIDVTVSPPKIVREGAVSRRRIERVTGFSVDV